MNGLFGRLASWRDRTLASPDFRAWAARFPLTRPVARRRSRALFDLCAGFAYSQTLAACVSLDLFTILHAGPQTAAGLAPHLVLTPERTERLCDAAAALKLLARRGTAYGLGPLGAAMVGNAGVAAMVRHHAILYGDLADPVALLRGRDPTGLAAYWPYGAAGDPAALGATDIAAYSALMADSQPLVAAEIFAAYDVGRHRCLLDIGGGEGAFLEQAAARAPHLALRLFDLPAVASRAANRLGARVTATGGDMRRDKLPDGADLLTLIRVIHDHDDDSAMAILRAARAATPPDGTLLLAEPMLDVPGAEPVGAYFILYLLALGSGRPRRQAELTAMLHEAGFSRVTPARMGNPLITSMLIARL
ncbi:MAG: acetylserotonin O-methyltransferase [Pseudomonadota bacterium]|nr:acetylserotonin O-methyltransferase [Pseudomonadota bacterium]